MGDVTINGKCSVLQRVGPFGCSFFSTNSYPYGSTNSIHTGNVTIGGSCIVNSGDDSACFFSAHDVYDHYDGSSIEMGDVIIKSIKEVTVLVSGNDEYFFYAKEHYTGLESLAFDSSIVFKCKNASVKTPTHIKQFDDEMWPS
jgi:hypothetical protein